MMTNREYFLREDLLTYKRKFKLVCREKNLEIKKYNEILAQLKDNSYICRIIIKEIKDGRNI